MNIERAQKRKKIDVPVLTKEQQTELVESGWFPRDEALTFFEIRGASRSEVETIAKRHALPGEILQFVTPPTDARRSRHASPGGASRYFYAPELMFKIADGLATSRPRSWSRRKMTSAEIQAARVELAARIKRRMIGT